MPITSIRRDWGVDPTIIRIASTDDLATITTAGYIASQEDIIEEFNHGAFKFKDGDLMAILFDGGEAIFNYDLATDTIIAGSGTGDVVVPTRATYLAHFTDTTGTISSDAGTVMNEGSMVLTADASPFSFTTQSPNGTRLSLLGLDNPGVFHVAISESVSVGQHQTVFIPDAGSSSANFLLDEGDANIIPYQDFVGISEIIYTSTGTWSVTRIAAFDYRFEKIGATSPTIIGIDITAQIRTAANKGFRLTSLTYIYAISGTNLVAHSISLASVEYVNNAAPLKTIVALGGSPLATAIQAQPYVQEFPVTTPAFNNESNSRLFLEINVDASSGANFGISGVVLNYDETIA